MEDDALASSRQREINRDSDCHTTGPAVTATISAKHNEKRKQMPYDGMTCAWLGDEMEIVGAAAAFDGQKERGVGWSMQHRTAAGKRRRLIANTNEKRCIIPNGIVWKMGGCQQQQQQLQLLELYAENKIK